MAATQAPKQSQQAGPAARKLRILFIAEAVTLAHVARPAVLAMALDKSQYDITFAVDPRYKALFPELADVHHDLWSIDSKQFLTALAKGERLYSTQILERYISDDLKLIEDIKPDLIVGDFRLSLSVSARLKKVPYAAISNTYWTTFSNNKYCVPQLPMTKILGVSLSQILFNLSRPLVFATHCIPLNKVRKKYGLPSLGHDLRAVYSDADHLWLADMAEYFPTTKTAANADYIGPLPWSPRNKIPPWWNDVDDTKPIVYVTLGSSGQVNLLPIVLEALVTLPVSVIAVTAGRTTLQAIPDNAYISDYLPGDQAAARADLVICNGGSLSTYQAIQGGTPILGIASNLDQHLNMHYLSSAGIGEVIRSEYVSTGRIREAATQLLADTQYKNAAAKAQKAAQGYNIQGKLTTLVHAALKPKL
ncbi:MAG: glycosyltransferase [Gammaproteobacteria bacterium]|nr:glycosyltransferase [Gammaproteobacteria bacterium]MBQ0838614.1 glycosyltransferase [Gammaproteobacteria bacterium]